MPIVDESDRRHLNVGIGQRLAHNPGRSLSRMGSVRGGFLAVLFLGKQISNFLLLGLGYIVLSRGAPPARLLLKGDVKNANISDITG
jgi:hypothetical protein